MDECTCSPEYKQAKQKFAEAVQEFLSATAIEHGDHNEQLVTGWMLATSSKSFSADSRGTSYSLTVPDGQPMHETLGFVRYATLSTNADYYRGD